MMCRDLKLFIYVLAVCFYFFEPAVLPVFGSCSCVEPGFYVLLLFTGQLQQFTYLQLIGQMLQQRLFYINTLMDTLGTAGWTDNVILVLLKLLYVRICCWKVNQTILKIRKVTRTGQL